MAAPQILLRALKFASPYIIAALAPKIENAVRSFAEKRAGTAKAADEDSRSHDIASWVYPGDYKGLPTLEYRPHADAHAQPGEIVWTWVPYEDDPEMGKDRPVLLIGEQDGYLLGLPTTSKDHDLDAEQENAAGRYWMDIGSGDWDRERRETEVRLDRIVRVHPDDIRRIAGGLDKRIFDQVAAGVRRHWND